MRPVLAGRLHIADLDDGKVTLLQVSQLNDALDAQAENEHRAREAARRSQEK